MSGSVIIRGETTIVDGLIYHDDQPISWDAADEKAGFRLDRRKAWAFVEGRLSELIRWTQACSGCSYQFEPRGGGCDECGYHGVVRNGCWVPASINARRKQPNRRAALTPELENV
jgi:hypothetical protein